MSIIIIFENGSNPYVRYNMSVAEFTAELKQWQKLYNLDFYKFFGDSVIEFLAKEN